MFPSTTSFVWELARGLLFCGLCGAGVWFVTRRREAWLRFVEHDLAADRRLGLPKSYINLARRFCYGKGILVLLWMFVGLSLLGLSSTIWLDLRSDRKQTVRQDLYAVIDQVRHQPPSIERASEFVRKLHAINTDDAPAEVKKALSDYTTACEQAVETWKATGDSYAYSQEIREQSRRLRAALNK